MSGLQSTPGWWLAHRADQSVRPLADRHYNRQSVGHPQFAPPGACVVLALGFVDAFWITSLPRAEFTKHAWPGAWICSAFRNESAHRSSDLIRAAVAATRAVRGEPPEVGMVTFVDPRKVRHKRDPGRCFIRAGFRVVGHTKGGLLALRLSVADMPGSCPPSRLQGVLL